MTPDITIFKLKTTLNKIKYLENFIDNSEQDTVHNFKKTLFSDEYKDMLEMVTIIRTNYLETDDEIAERYNTYIRNKRDSIINDIIH